MILGVLYHVGILSVSRRCWGAWDLRINRACGDELYVSYVSFVRFANKARDRKPRAAIANQDFNCSSRNSDLPPRAAFDKRVGGDVAEWSKALPC